MVSYIAVLTQTGADAPEANVFGNGIGPVTWTRESMGVYYGEAPDPFLEDETHILCSATTSGTSLIVGAFVNNGKICLYFNNEDAVNIINLEVRIK